MAFKLPPNLSFHCSEGSGGNAEARPRVSLSHCSELREVQPQTQLLAAATEPLPLISGIIVTLTHVLTNLRRPHPPTSTFHWFAIRQLNVLAEACLYIPAFNMRTFVWYVVSYSSRGFCFYNSQSMSWCSLLKFQTIKQQHTSSSSHTGAAWGHR